MQIDDRSEGSPEGGTSSESQTTGESKDPEATTSGLISTGHEPHVAGGMSLDYLGADFCKFCEQNYARLVRIAKRITQNPWDAQDAVQDVLEKFWKRWPEQDFRDRVWNVPGYSHRCIVYAAVDNIRSEQSRYKRQEKDARKEVGKDSDFLRVDDDDSFARALEVLRGLNPTWRLVILLRYARECTIVEVAAILRISESTARRYERKALKALEEAYKRI